MTKDRILSYARELGGVVKQANEIIGAIDQLNGQISIAEKLGDTEQAKRFITQRLEYRQILEKVTSVVQDKSNRSTVSEAERLLSQFSSRFEQLQALEQQMYRLEAEHELAASLGHFEGEEGIKQRQSVEEGLAQARKQVDTQIALLDQLVPSRPVILSA